MNDKTKEPNEIVVRLIRDHEYISDFCYRIIKGIAMEKPEERIVEYVDNFWCGHLSLHMKAEEEILFVLQENVLLKKAFEEHRFIERKIRSCLSAKGQQLRNELPTLIDFIDTHLHFEEDELYPLISNSLTNWQIRIITWQLIGIPIGENRDRYTDKFWIN